MCSLVTSYCPLSLLTSRGAERAHRLAGWLAGGRRGRVTAHRCTTPRCSTDADHNQTVPDHPRRPDPLPTAISRVISAAHRPRADVIVTRQRRVAGVASRQLARRKLRIQSGATTRGTKGLSPLIPKCPKHEMIQTPKHDSQ